MINVTKYVHSLSQKEEDADGCLLPPPPGTGLAWPGFGSWPLSRSLRRLSKILQAISSSPPIPGEGPGFVPGAPGGLIGIEVVVAPLPVGPPVEPTVTIGFPFPVGPTVAIGFPFPVGPTVAIGFPFPVGPTVAIGFPFPVGPTVAIGFPLPVGPTVAIGFPFPVGPTVAIGFPFPVGPTVH